MVNHLSTESMALPSQLDWGYTVLQIVLSAWSVAWLLFVISSMMPYRYRQEGGASHHASEEWKYPNDWEVV
jgi:hypothetical protein